MKTTMTDEGREFLDAFRHAVQQGNFVIRPDNFKGWGEVCNCESCLSQKAIWDFAQSCKGVT